MQFEGHKKVWQVISNLSPIFVLGTIWGMTFVILRSATFELSPVNLTLLRWFIASVALLFIVPFTSRSRKKFEISDLPRLLLISLLSVPIHHLFLNIGLTLVTCGVAGFIISFSRVLIVGLSAYVLKEKIGWKLIFALLLGITGAIVISSPNLELGSNWTIFGPFAVALASLAFAIFAVMSKPLLLKYGSTSVTVWSSLIGTAMLLPLLSPSFVSEVATLSLTGWLSVFYASLLSSVAGYLLFYALVRRKAVSRLSIQLFLVPVISAVGGVLLLQEEVTIQIVVGGAMVLTATALATMNKKFGDSSRKK